MSPRPCRRGLRLSRKSKSCPEIVAMTTLGEKLIKIGAEVVSHGRYVAFQMAEVAIPRNLFADILRLISELRPPPAASAA